MLKFNLLIFALILAPALLSAQTPNPAAGGTIANSSRGGVITGRVTDSQGEPVVEERIRVYRVDSASEARPVYVGTTPDMYVTDDRGVYRIFGLPLGRYLVSAGYLAREGPLIYPTPRFFYPQTFHPNVTDRAQAKVIEVTEGSESTGIDIILAEHKRSYDIYGRVVNADTGEPVAGVALSY
ncbi:MAG: carboxypeptidase-like regulatory domain-containing protein [Acidobacteria bacterium]|nr:carboxypeptidase-like regulatory domain-containing protein [Acidobacteriota bacterium]